MSTIFNNLDAIAAQHGKGAELNLEAAASVKGVPYHPGAAKYFEEKGLKVDAVKDGAGTGTAAALSFGTGGDTGTYYGFRQRAGQLRLHQLRLQGHGAHLRRLSGQR
ncbi:MAG: TAXI family TRAP transporter solute-binding subunit [Oscillospiraceae bacterium]